MTPADILKSGDVHGAVEALKAEVRQHPADPRRRTFLFELLAVGGDWERSLTQLNVAGDLDASTLAMVQTYRVALQCEVLREEVFAGRRTPLVFGEPERWVALALESLRRFAAGRFQEAASLREEAWEAAPEAAGSLNGESFEGIADADPRIGPFLELIVNGNYYWVPFHRLSRLSLEAPVDLRDLVWLPAQVTWANGGQAVGLIPTRYPGSTAAGDDRLALARLTDWRRVREGMQIGLGQRLLATDQSDYSLLEIRELVVATGEAAVAGGASA